MTLRVGRATRQLFFSMGGALFALHCALPGFTIGKGDGSGGSDLGGAAGESSGGSDSGGSSSGGGSTGSGGLGGLAGSGSGSGGDGGDGSGGAGACGEVGQACCDSGPNGGCDAPHECLGGTCEALSSWQLQQKLLAVLPGNVPDGAADAAFGYSVAVSGDTALIGSPSANGQGNGSGSAYVFVRTGSEWTIQQKLTPMLPGGSMDGAAEDNFGYRVALSGDTAVIAAIGDDDQGAESGSAYVFVRSGTEWSAQQKLIASLPGGVEDGSAADLFGVSVAVDGDTAVIGASFDDDDDGSSLGSAYVFVRSGSAWTVQQKLTAQVPGGAADRGSGDFFGTSVAIAGDRILVGSPEDDDQGIGSGSAYVFTRIGTAWSVEQKLGALVLGGTLDGAAGDNFGSSVALSANAAIIGSHRNDDDGTDSGSAYIFTRSDTEWLLEQKLTATLPGGTPDGVADGQFGLSVAVSGDTLVVGSHANGVGGAAYTFVRDGSGWLAQQKLSSPPGDTASQFGFSVSVSGETALIGAYGYVDQADATGAAYVFAFE